MLGAAHQGPRPGRSQAMSSQAHPGRGVDLEGGAAQALAQLHLHPGQAWWHRVAVAPEGRAGVGADPGHQLHRGRVGGSGQGQEHLGGGPLGHRGPPGSGPVGGRLLDRSRWVQPLISGGGAEAVQAELGLDGGGGGHGSPPSPAGEAHGRLHHPLAVTPPRRARFHHRPVVLGHGGEARLHVPAAGHDHAGQPVGAPDPGCPADAA